GLESGASRQPVERICVEQALPEFRPLLLGAKSPFRPVLLPAKLASPGGLVLPTLWSQSARRGNKQPGQTMDYSQRSPKVLALPLECGIRREVKGIDRTRIEQLMNDGVRRGEISNGTCASRQSGA